MTTTHDMMPSSWATGTPKMNPRASIPTTPRKMTTAHYIL